MKHSNHIIQTFYVLFFFKRKKRASGSGFSLCIRLQLYEIPLCNKKKNYYFNFTFEKVFFLCPVIVCRNDKLFLKRFFSTFTFIIIISLCLLSLMFLFSRNGFSLSLCCWYFCVNYFNYVVVKIANHDNTSCDFLPISHSM